MERPNSAHSRAPLEKRHCLHEHVIAGYHLRALVDPLSPHSSASRMKAIIDTHHGEDSRSINENAHCS